MLTIQWDSSFSVNVSEIDKNHQQLILMVNGLDNAMSWGKGRQIIGKTIDELVSFATSNFKLEENYFDRLKKFQAADHKKEHADFIQNVTKFKADFGAGNAWISIKVMNYLQTWIRNHLKSADKKYGPSFNENGLK
jgi:hemerythrin-like metal-binding protein